MGDVASDFNILASVPANEQRGNRAADRACQEGVPRLVDDVSGGECPPSRSAPCGFLGSGNVGYQFGARLMGVGFPSGLAGADAPRLEQWAVVDSIKTQFIIEAGDETDGITEVTGDRQGVAIGCAFGAGEIEEARGLDMREGGGDTGVRQQLLAQLVDGHSAGCHLRVIASRQSM